METQIFLINPNLPTFFFMFVLIYLFGYFVIFRKWGLKHIAEASSCLISLAHGTPAVFMAIYAITQSLTLNTMSHHSLFASLNTNTQNTVLEYSISYFLMDLLNYIIFFPNDILFIGHHLATLYVFVTCRYVVRHGALALLVLLVLAELTSACQNAWTLAGFRKDQSPKASRLYEYLSPRFYALYSVCRVVLGPVFVFKMVSFYASGVDHDVIPKWAWISWMFVITVAILVSINWVFNHWIEWFRDRQNRRVLKMKEI